MISTKNGRMGILFWTFVDIVLWFSQCCAKNRLSSSLHWWNGSVEPERPWLVLHWGLLLSQWTQNTRTGFLVILFLGISRIYHPIVKKCLWALKKRNPCPWFSWGPQDRWKAYSAKAGSTGSTGSTWNFVDDLGCRPCPWRILDLSRKERFFLFFLRTSPGSLVLNCVVGSLGDSLGLH